MIHLQVLPLLLLLLIYPLHIKGKVLEAEDEELVATKVEDFIISLLNTLTKLDAGERQDTRNIELKLSELTNAVKMQSEIIEVLGEKMENQEENIRDLHKSLDERLGEDDLKVILKILARQEKKMDDLLALHQVEDVAESTTASPESYTEVDEPGSCAEIGGGHANGVHKIYPNDTNPVPAMCDNSNGGGWTVIQKRFDGSVDFYRGWEDYAEGFGYPAGEYWLGLRAIHALTQAQAMELYVGMTDIKRGFFSAKYNSFSVSSEEDKFRLHVGNYSGNASDSLRYHDGQPFSTKDQDNDMLLGSCSQTYHGAWWYKYCYDSNLNGLFSRVEINDVKYMIWWDIPSGSDRHLNTSLMMIRPSNFRPLF